MSKRQLTSQNITTIIIAIIGMIGSVLVAYFAFRGNTAPIELAINATQTAEAKQNLSKATLTTIVSTNTPTISPTATLQTSTPTLLPEYDFSTNCINASIWIPSPNSSKFTRDNNCWDLSSIGIAAQEGKLFFAIQNSAEQRGAIYTPIPKEGTISFNVRIDTFISGQTNGNLAFGVSTADNWLSKGKFVFFRATNSGYYIVYGGEVAEVGKITIDAYETGSDVLVTYEFKNLVFDIYVNNTKIVPDIPISSSQQVF
ncbi:hypothetical protein ANAEL_05092 [Anaerolineales bacterium]|nr:hypothetical protein ANAEL_05092 [Anaerolineales bacterium]